MPGGGSQVLTDFKDVVEKTDAELAAAMERRREQGKRLQEMQSRQRAEKASLLLLASTPH